MIGVVVVVGTGTRVRKARRVGTGTHGPGYTAATVLLVVVVGTRTRGLSSRPRALEEADRVPLVQDRRRRGPVVFGEVGDVAHRRVLPAGDRGVEPRRLPPRRRREVGQRAAPEAAALTCVFFCHLPDLRSSGQSVIMRETFGAHNEDWLAARPPASHRGTQTKVSQNQSSGSGFDGAAMLASARRPRSRGTAARPCAACAAPAPVRRWAAGPAVKFLCRPCF